MNMGQRTDIIFPITTYLFMDAFQKGSNNTKNESVVYFLIKHLIFNCRARNRFCRIVLLEKF